MIRTPKTTAALPIGICLLFADAVVAPAHAEVIGMLKNPDNCATYYLLASDTWSASQQEAAELGGNLVTINSAAENDWIFENFTSYGGIKRDLWLGLNDVDSEGNFTWVSGESVEYINWQPENPSNSGTGQDYVLMFAGPSGVHISDWIPGKWDDFSSPENALSSYELRSGGIREVYGLVEVPFGQKAFNGLFYDPQNSGHGFDFNVLEEGLIVYYYGHTSNGERLWLISALTTESISLGTPLVLEMFEIETGTFGEPESSPTPWGSITLTMLGYDTGEALFEGRDGILEMDLVRLASLSGSRCNSSPGGGESEDYSLLWGPQEVIVNTDSSGVPWNLEETAMTIEIVGDSGAFTHVRESPSSREFVVFSAEGDGNITPGEIGGFDTTVATVAAAPRMTAQGVPKATITLSIDVAGHETLTLVQTVTKRILGIWANDVVGTNTEHRFLADSSGQVYDNDFSCRFKVNRAGTPYTYDESTPYTDQSFRYEDITFSEGISDVHVNAGNGSITINGSSTILKAGGPDSATIDVKIIDNDYGDFLRTMTIYLSK